MTEQTPARAHRDRTPSGPSRRQFLSRAAAGTFTLGLGASAAEQLLAAPSAQAATAFGYGSGGGYYTVN
ncbi:MAG: hypothetical protein ACRDVE_21685, partial [Actinocrinis sp.]